MAKVTYTKIEQALGLVLDQVFIDRLIELTLLADTSIGTDSPKTIIEKENILHRFQMEWKRLQKREPKLAIKVGLSHEQEKKILGSLQALNADDWASLKRLKSYMEEIRKHHVARTSTPEDQSHVLRERSRRRYLNVRKGWMPLR